MHTIELFRKGGSWVARFSELTGYGEIATPFSSDTHPDIVLAEITSRNPDRKVYIKDARPLLSDTIKDKLLTDDQIMRKVIAATKAYIKEKQWTAIKFRYIRGTYHFDNCASYWLTAKEILEAATGLQFMHMDNSMASRVK